MRTSGSSKQGLPTLSTGTAVKAFVPLTTGRETPQPSWLRSGRQGRLILRFVDRVEGHFQQPPNRATFECDTLIYL